MTQMSEAEVNQASALTAAVAPQTAGGEPPKRADQCAGQAPASGRLRPPRARRASTCSLAFLVPLILVVYTSLQSGGLLSGGYTFTWAFDNYSGRVLDVRRSSIAKSLVYLGDWRRCSASCSPTRWRTGSRSTRGQWKSTLFFLILVPFFVSFVIRTVQWKFILADDGVLFGPLKSIGLLPEDFQVLAGRRRGDLAGITYNFLPFTALPLYVALERIDKRLVEAAKDLYASQVPGVPQGGAAAVVPGRVRGA